MVRVVLVKDKGNAEAALTDLTVAARADWRRLRLPQVEEVTKTVRLAADARWIGVATGN